MNRPDERTDDGATTVEATSPMFSALAHIDSRYAALLARGFHGADGETADSDRLTEITNILGNPETVAALSDDELSALDGELNELIDRILDGSAAGIARRDIERLTEARDAVVAVRGEAAARVEAEERNQAEVDALLRDIRVQDDDEADDNGGNGESEGDGAEGDNGGAEGDESSEGEGDDAEEGAEEREPVTAGAAPALPTLRELAARVPGPNRAQRRAGGFELARTEHPFIRAIEQRRNVTVSDLANLMIERWRDTSDGGYSGPPQKFRLGRISWADEYGPERTLRSEDSFEINDAKLEAVTAAAMNPASWTPEIVASGGFCAPTPASYDLVQISGAQRPLRDSLPSFNADRGGIRFTPPPDLADILVDQSGGAIGEWTNTTDITPGGTTKTCQSISCAAVQEVLTKAIYRCLGFGNFGARAYPEHVRVWTLNAAAAWARKAEQEILDSVSGNSTAITSTGLYGFVSELLTHIIQLAYGERSRQRMPQDTRLRVWLPSWVPGQMQIDLLRQGNVVTEVRTVESIRAMFAAVNVNVTFYDDSRTGAGQVQGAQAAAELRDLPEVVEWYLFHEGAHTFLDGGELDLGIVRDSTLNQTNDFRIFAENWEETAYRGIFSYRVRSTLCPSGDRQIPIDGDPCGAS